MINSCLESFMLVDVISSINSSGGGGEVLKTGPVEGSVFDPDSSANTLTEYSDSIFKPLNSKRGVHI